ncbi:ArsR family transcriptional regulator [Catellatospora bangladeshensis]|uniref:ArsR family transcriptional regulator n=1 Tax=Catellatospora bangladeshensis TaxID=310355 RepID=UPI00360ED2BD
MLRIHFTAADLGAVRLAAGADPLWESLLSQHLLRGGATPPILGQWRAGAIARLTPQMRALMGLAPPTGYSADFLTPTSGVRDIAAGIDAVLATPREHLRADLHRLVARRPSSGWLRRLADGDRRALSALAAVMRSYFDAVLGPHWDLIASQVAAARARGARSMVDGGVDRLLTTLHPAVRWEAPTLHVAYPVDRDLHLDGRGLVLMPSFFCRRTPVTLRAADRPPVLVYPIDDELGWAAARRRPVTACSRCSARPGPRCCAPSHSIRTAAPPVSWPCRCAYRCPAPASTPPRSAGPGCCGPARAAGTPCTPSRRWATRCSTERHGPRGNASHHGTTS